jgi:hypothetical protein
MAIAAKHILMVSHLPQLGKQRQQPHRLHPDRRRNRLQGSLQPRKPGINKNSASNSTAIHASQFDAQPNGVTCGTGNSDKNHKNKSTTSKTSMIIAALRHLVTKTVTGF